MTLEIILIIFSIILSAFFSSAEAAFLSVQKTKLFQMVNLKQKGADTVAKLLENKDKLLSTIVLGNNIVNITFAALLTSLIYKITNNPTLTTILTTLFGTIILMIFGEVIPKALAVRLAEKLSLIYSRPIKIFEIIFNANLND
jgi:Mg2+/Co2+ transporter CorB